MSVTPSITLRTLTLAECLQVREWRQAPDVLPMLRTGAQTVEEQTEFYWDHIRGGSTRHRFYALAAQDVFIGMGGLTYLDRRPGVGEISLLIGPAWRRAGYGTAAVDALLAEGFGTLGLQSVVGECYRANPARRFWERLLDRDRCLATWQGDSLCFAWGDPKVILGLVA